MIIWGITMIASVFTGIAFGVWQNSITAGCFISLFIQFIGFCVEQIVEAIKAQKD